MHVKSITALTYLPKKGQHLENIKKYNAFQSVKDKALTAAESCTFCTYSGELISLVWKARVSQKPIC